MVQSSLQRRPNAARPGSIGAAPSTIDRRKPASIKLQEFL
jgi:hypothetical protein